MKNSKFGPATLGNPNPQSKIQIFLNQMTCEILRIKKERCLKGLGNTCRPHPDKEVSIQIMGPTAVQVNLSSNKLMVIDQAAKTKMIVNFLPTINFKIGISVHIISN